MTLAVNIAQIGSNNTTFRNRIINGAMGIWQRGTSFTSGGTATYTADRFYGNGSSGTISRSTDVPAGFTYSFSNAASSTAFPGITQRIESVNIADCASQAITVSFYVKQTSGTASALNINLAYPSAVDNWGSSTTIVETNVVATMPSSWTRYSYTYTLPANVTNGLSATLFIPSGSVTATFLITGVQLEAGSTASPFEYRSYGTELALCQRYYEIYSNGTGTSAIFEGLGGYFANSSIFRTAVPFKVTKRASPSVSVPITYLTVNCLAGNLTPSGAGSNFSSPDGAAINCYVSGATGGQGATLGISSSAPVKISAEL